MLQSDCHCEEGSNVSVFLPRVDTVRDCVDSESGQKSCTDSLDSSIVPFVLSVDVNEVRQYHTMVTHFYTVLFVNWLILNLVP